MRVSILLQITDDHGITDASEEVAAFEKATERPEDLGLLMAEGKTLLAAIQSKTVMAQVTEWSARDTAAARAAASGVGSKEATRFSSIHSTAMLNCVARDCIVARARAPRVRRPCRHCGI
jgi:hypothetical protein